MTGKLTLPNTDEANSEVQFFRVCAQEKLKERDAELFEQLRPNFATFQRRRIARVRDTGEAVLLERKPIQKAVTFKPRRSTKFVGKLPGGAELIRQWIAGEIPWDDPSDEQIWESAVALANDAEKRCPIAELGYLSTFLNVILAKRAGIELHGQESEA